MLAIVLDIGETSVNKLIADKQAITPELALALEEVFKVAADAFLDIQKRYELAKARIASHPDPGRNVRAYLFGDLPIGEMIRRGWLAAENVRDKKGVEKALLKFFSAKTLEDIEVLPHAAKKTMTNVPPTPTQLAWLYRVRQITSEMIVAPYSASAVRDALKKLSALLSAPEEARKVPRILAECGIRYVIVESLPAAKIDGVCFWLNDSPVIGMSMRYDRIDNFWFVLRHELEHVLRLHGRAAAVAVIDAELEGERAGTGANVPEEERVANEAAADFCVPTQSMNAFIARKDPLFSERDILGFARTLNVHPGLAAGQLHSKTGRYELFRHHLVKIRAAVAPSAIVDGWGNVVPVGT